MSLDDIIQKKKKEKIKKVNNRTDPPPIKNVPLHKKLPVVDARNKIISKKRIQITDARDKLAELAKQKDARLKLDKLRMKRMAGLQGLKSVFPPRGKFTRTIQNKDLVFGDPSRQVAYQSEPRSRHPSKQTLHTKKFLESRSIGIKSKHDIPRMKDVMRKDIMRKPMPIIRTVQNDIQIIDDPMEEDYIEPKRSSQNRTASLQLKIIAHNEDRHKSRSSSIIVQRPTASERDMSPPRPPSILKKRPMAALRSDQMAQKSEKPAMEYRIIVSNLRNTVTGVDIEELFGDVGGMLESRLVRPGTAEVIYQTQEHAQKAVELYHNRQLDGQPMNCLLVTPRTPSSVTSQRNSNKPALYSTNSNVEPDLTTFHKVLFSNL